MCGCQHPYLHEEDEWHPLVVGVVGDGVVELRRAHPGMRHLLAHLASVKAVHGEGAHDEAVAVHHVIERVGINVSEAIDLVTCGKYGNDSVRSRNSLGHMAPLGLTGERCISRRAASTLNP